MKKYGDRLRGPPGVVGHDGFSPSADMVATALLKEHHDELDRMLHAALQSKTPLKGH